MINYFDEHVSFNVLINLLSSKKKKYVVFKPMISIVTTDKNRLNKIIKILDVNVNIYERDVIVRKQKVKRYEVRVQHFDTIKKVLQNVNIQEIKSDNKKENMRLFNKIFEKILLYGHIHTEWDDNFLEIIQLKNQLNLPNRTRTGFTVNQWINKIKNHFSGVLDG